jgi:hypothetical protein
MSGRIWAVCLFASGFALLHCGGTVVTLPADGSGGAAGHGGQLGHAGTASGAGHGGGGSSAVARDAGFDEYVDPGCPDAGPPSEVNECDAFATNSGCPPGEGCYPFVDHPFGAGCGAQSFGTACMPAGSGVQGAVCGDGAACASGFVCVVGSQPGKRCVQLCRMTEPNSCPRGFICGELDVEGYGVCS